MNAVIVAIKVTIVLFFIALGMGHIDPANYHLAPGPATAGALFPISILGSLTNMGTLTAFVVVSIGVFDV